MKKLMAVLLVVVMIALPFEMAFGARAKRTIRGVKNYSQKRVRTVKAAAKKKTAVRKVNARRASLRNAAVKRKAIAKRVAVARRAAAAKKK